MPSSHRLCGAGFGDHQLYPNSCAITEIGAVRVREGHIIDQFQQLVNPLRPIPRPITTLTGITDAMVADLDPIDEVLPRFIAWLATPAAGPAVEPIVDADRLRSAIPGLQHPAYRRLRLCLRGL